MKKQDTKQIIEEALFRGKDFGAHLLTLHAERLLDRTQGETRLLHGQV